MKPRLAQLIELPACETSESASALLVHIAYVYDQLTGDSGDHVGPFMSRVVGVGPQVGYIFPLGDKQAYVNLKGYREFDAHDRAHGYNAWLTVSISPPAPTPPPSATPRTMMTMYTK